MTRKACALLATLLLLSGIVSLATEGAAATPADTGVSGVYEVIVGASDAARYEKYFAEFGFRVIERAEISAEQANSIYGVRSRLRSVRMQNGEIDSHGLLRVLEWTEPLGPGVGYAPPETIGQRMAVMRTEDIYRLVDLYKASRDAGEPWLAIDPVYDDLYGMTEGKPGFFNRPVGVRETAIYGDLFNHVFFQRYGYQIPGYGTIGEHSPLRSSEFTHHDFVVGGAGVSPTAEALAAMTDYYRDVLGFRDEGGIVLDGDWQVGPQRVFGMEPGTSHWYRGFVSPNDICGKLKFFLPTGPRPDRSKRQRVGELGITLHSVFAPEIEPIHRNAAESGLDPSPIGNNEFGERSFLFVGPDGAAWQIIERAGTTEAPVTEFELVRTNH